SCNKPSIFISEDDYQTRIVLEATIPVSRLSSLLRLWNLESQTLIVSRIFLGQFYRAHVAAMLQNNFLRKAAENRTAFGVKVVKTNEVILLGKAAGYDSIFIDLEHCVLPCAVLLSTIVEDNTFCTCAISVRPGIHAKSSKVLDAGTMGIIFLHIDTGLSNKDILQLDDAENAISTTQFPLREKCLLTAAITQFEFQGDGTKEEIKQLVFTLVGTVQCLDNIVVIAALEGIDVLLVGAMTYSRNSVFQENGITDFKMLSIHKISNTARRYGKNLGLAGMLLVRISLKS
ncbi:hypothetical protein DPV78_005048, partial [Talaromyces pinophilus]